MTRNFRSGGSPVYTGWSLLDSTKLLESSRELKHDSSSTDYCFPAIQPDQGLDPTKYMSISLNSPCHVPACARIVLLCTCNRRRIARCMYGISITHINLREHLIIQFGFPYQYIFPFCNFCIIICIAIVSRKAVLSWKGKRYTMFWKFRESLIKFDVDASLLIESSLGLNGW